jgi:conjugal transfer pilus assembly protein TraW
VRIQFIKSLLLGTFACCVAHVASGTGPDDEWLAKSRQIMDEASKATKAPEWLRTDPGEEAMTAAQELLAEQRKIAEDKWQAPHSLDTPGQVLIFGTLKMPEQTLRNLLEQARAPDVIFLLKGLPDGKNIKEAVNKLAALSKGFATPPNVIVDPTLFDRYRITVAPTLVLRREGNVAPVIVAGAVTVKWLRDRAGRLLEGGSANLGERGETFAIAERSLVEEMQRRMANVDWEAQREKAIQDFWKKKEFITLPLAAVDGEREVDPSVRVSEDIVDGDGKVLVRAGSVFNPLDSVPMSKTIFVFDGLDKKQIAKVLEQSKQVLATGHGVVLITTRVDSGLGWKSLDGLETDFQLPVYLLQQDLADRLQLRHVPSSVSGRGNRLLVKEYAVKP